MSQTFHPKPTSTLNQLNKSTLVHSIIRVCFYLLSKLYLYLRATFRVHLIDNQTRLSADIICIAVWSRLEWNLVEYISSGSIVTHKLGPHFRLLRVFAPGLGTSQNFAVGPDHLGEVETMHVIWKKKEQQLLQLQILVASEPMNKFNPSVLLSEEFRCKLKYMLLVFFGNRLAYIFFKRTLRSLLFRGVTNLFCLK